MRRRVLFSRVIFSMIVVLFVCPAFTRAGEAEPDPVAFRQRCMGNPWLKRSGTGEAFCWHAAASGSREYLTAYQAYKNPAWLAEGEKYYDWYLSKLQKDPDGYEGFIGNAINVKPGEKAALQTDTVVGDAVLFRPIVEWAAYHEAPGEP